jgi:hypothetical protein
MRAPLRWTMNLAAGTAVIAVVMLGAWWASDRARRWERPRWNRESFEPLRAVPLVEPRGMARWVVVVNPRCPSCLETLWRLHHTWSRHAAGEQLVALIVDTPVRPDPRALRRLPPIPLWWDRENRWRRRWGHRLYGELIQFDVAGRHLRTITAAEAARIRRPRAPGDPTAPALERRGGT